MGSREQVAAWEGKNRPQTDLVVKTQAEGAGKALGVGAWTEPPAVLTTGTPVVARLPLWRGGCRSGHQEASVRPEAAARKGSVPQR